MSDALADFRAAYLRLEEEISRLRTENEELRAGLRNDKKLSPREVARIRDLRADGWKQRDIADAFDINPATVSRIVRGEYWR
ncbi:Hypothetical protein AJAP_27895 [Amycolatopsis japonica]|uniref:Uncharacterized protein n=1 Tax=Amycolatopsis japonica TaxID=208439 RepID=A0A075UZL6_9PSEU|nr:helix-turn-helix domain-containing protein [Amycolatopsis japonica]AIG78423.1 Hypothetical protein AJAP_27895 [Amycolatopsis japonica]